jgi:diguanylate cyclase (GGDEF)-like protein
MARDILAHADTSTHQPASSTTPSEAASTLQTQFTLPAILSKRDLTVLMLLVILFIANTNGVQFAGPSAFFYWTLGLLTFLVPCAYVTQWLASHFPGQAAPYLWASRILGPRWSFFSAFCAWLPGVLAVVSTIESGLLFMQYLVPTWFVTPTQQGIAIILVLLVPTAITCLPLRWLRHILRLIAVFYVGAFLLLGVAGGWWLMHGHSAALAFNRPASWLPTPGNGAVYGVIILAYLGVDVPLFMGGEIRGGDAGVKRATSYVWWGVAVTAVAYMVGTFGIMAIVPPSQAGTMAAPMLTVRAVFGPAAATATAITFAVSQISVTIVYLLLFSRLLLVLAQDRRLPVGLAVVNRFGVPVRSIIAQAGVVAIVTILALVTLPILFGAFLQTGELALMIYNIMQAATTIIWVASLIQMFMFVPWLLFHHGWRDRVPCKKRMLLLGMVFLGTGASLAALWVTASSSWLPGQISNKNWTILVLGVALFSGLMGWLGGELPRMYALLREQKQATEREMRLHAKLQESFNEQQVLVQQQQVLVDELNRLYHEQALAALTDAVTGLPNHRAIIAEIEGVISSCQQSLSSCAMLFIDLDHFKQINDTWGHRAGDAILREVGRRLRSSVRQEDLVGRYGGEEFALVLREVGIQEASETAERILNALRSQPCEWEREDTQAIVSIAVTASIGVAIYQLHGCTREEMIHHADQAMYRAKRTGRNRVCIADTSLDDASQMPPCRQEDLLIEEDRLREQTGVQALAIAAAARDGVTGTHAHRMSLLIEAVGHHLNLAEEELHLLRLSAIVHDLGKIGIPDAILNKAGPLTEQEWAIMRTHPEIGQQMLEELGGVFSRLAKIVVAHHERWDGNGYPHRIAGEQIPLCARILSVVDAYDAMTSRRPYHEPLTTSEARAELQRCSGSQFDPRIVSAFMQVIEAPEMALSNS